MRAECNFQGSTRHAFTLVELLVVVGIIVVLIALAGKALSVDNSGKELAVNGQNLARHFDHARQLAVTYNQYVQVRFYSPGGTTGVTRIGTFLAESPYYGTAGDYDAWSAAGRFRAEGKDFILKPGLVIAGEASASKLIDLLRNDTATARTGSASLGGVDHDFVAFYYRPDGTPDFQWMGGGELSPDDAYLTLVQDSRYQVKKPALPDNYLTLVFVPATGRTVMLRP